jgi:hypothetical protein
MRSAALRRFVVFAQFSQICADLRKASSDAPVNEAFLSFLRGSARLIFAIRPNITRVFEEKSHG